MPEAILSGLMFGIPLPEKWAISPENHSLGDILFSVAGDRLKLFDALRSPEKFVPIVYIALMLASFTHKPLPSFYQDQPARYAKIHMKRI